MGRTLAGQGKRRKWKPNETPESVMNGCGHTAIKGQGDNVDERMGAYEPSLVTDKRSRKGMLIAAFSRSVVWWKSITRE